MEPDKIWMALDRFVEDISKEPGGLVRWNRMEFVVDSIRVEGESLRLKNTRG
jgi:hypothetical protein